MKSILVTTMSVLVLAAGLLVAGGCTYTATDPHTGEKRNISHDEYRRLTEQ